LLRVAKFLSNLALILIIVWLGVLNTQPVTLVTAPQLLDPSGIGIFSIPLFLIIMSAVFVGFLVGCMTEYVRAGKTRKYLRERNSSLEESNMKLKKIEKNLELEDDDILSLLKR